MKSTGFIIALIMVALAMVMALPAGAQESSCSFEDSIKIGYDSRTCSAALEGSLRYSSAAKSIEFCDGLSWLAWGG